MIEIRKAGFVNKGAELMLYAILEKLRGEFPNIKFCMAPHPVTAKFEKRIELNLFQKPDIWYFNMQLGLFFNLLPKFIRDMYGIVVDNEVDIVLDTAGFAYGDTWNIKGLKNLADRCVKRKKYGTKIILLPQAFGPFDNDNTRNYMKKVIENVDLVYARDIVSYNHLKSISSESKNIKLFPDFTNLIQGNIPETFNPEINNFCIIPNYRMIDKTSKEISNNYLPFLIKSINYLIEKNEKPFILIHEGEKDLYIADQINASLKHKIPVIKESNALNIKGIIGQSNGVIGSRFHGLVSALSQGVPSLATSWSHKYQMLFQDYKYDEGIIDITDDEVYIKKKIDVLISNREEIRANLLLSSDEQKEKVKIMWNEIFGLIKNEN